MTDTETERPLVTFALFAYNQEEYIREAVEGAFSQTYEPLEIILSDDCSSDRTFEIMQEMAAEYKGPHRVIVRQNKQNFCLGLHMRDVVLLVKTKYIVVAAGDDISLPDRTSEIIAMMERDNSYFAESNYNKMNKNSYIELYNVENKYNENGFWKFIDWDTEIFVMGASAAYDVNFLKGAILSASEAISSGFLYNEDALVAAYAVAMRATPSKYKSAPLLNYRINPASFSNFRENRRSLASELIVVRQEAFRSRTRLALLDAIVEIAGKYPALEQHLKHDAIAANRRWTVIEISASEKSFPTRLRGIFTSRDRQEVLLRLVRLPGPWFHAAIRLMFSNFRKA